jgi:hypothetical protein
MIIASAAKAAIGWRCGAYYGQRGTLAEMEQCGVSASADASEGAEGVVSNKQTAGALAASLHAD